MVCDIVNDQIVLIDSVKKQFKLLPLLVRVGFRIMAITNQQTNSFLLKKKYFQMTTSLIFCLRMVSGFFLIHINLCGLFNAKSNTSGGTI